MVFRASLSRPGIIIPTSPFSRTQITTSSSIWKCSSCIYQTKRNVTYPRPRPPLSPVEIYRRSEPTSPPLPTYEELVKRGFIDQLSGERAEFKQLLDNKRIALYAGVDLTADSLHLGHLMVLMPLLHMWIRGHRAIMVLGGTTTRVGDPSGRSEERDLKGQDRTQRREREEKIKLQVRNFFMRGERYAKDKGWNVDQFGRRDIMNNTEWLDAVSAKEFFTVVGPNVRLGQLLARDSIKARVNSKDGISYGELSYQILQAYDYWHLYNHKFCRLQVGGGDQWGNITAGIDLVKRIMKYNGKSDKEIQTPFGMTVPLLTTSSGEKYGKSAGNAIWISQNSLSSYNLHQFLLKTPDDIVESHLKFFTLVSLDTIKHTMKDHKDRPEERLPQNLLANEVVTLLHGKNVLPSVIAVKDLIFPDKTKKPVDPIKEQSPEELQQFIEALSLHEDIYSQMPLSTVLQSDLRHLMVTTGLAKNSSQARQFLETGAVTFGREPKRIKQSVMIEQSMLELGSLLIIRVGRNMRAIRCLPTLETDSELDSAHKEEFDALKLGWKKGKVSSKKHAGKVNEESTTSEVPRTSE